MAQMRGRDTAESPAASSVPRFLQQLYDQEAARRRALRALEEQEEGQDGATTPSATSSSSASSAASTYCHPFAFPGQARAPQAESSVGTPFRQFAPHIGGHPQRTNGSIAGPASASSTTSSEPQLDFYPDSLDGFSSSESVISASSASTTSAISRSASPNAKNAFMSSYYHSPSGHIGGNWSPTLFSYLHSSSKENYQQLQALSLPPPSLDLPKSATPTLLGRLDRNKGKHREAPSIASATETTIFSPESVTPCTDENEVQPVAGSSTAEAELLLPPDNFAMVCPDIYRSSFPSKKHYPFLQSLGLKTVLTLVQDDYPQENADFFASQGINLVQIGIPGNKEPFVTIPDEKIRDALSIVLDKRNHPLFIHCNKGKHRTGCLVGCLRKMQCWSSTAVFEEYRKFSFPKSRAMDQLFIELFQPDWTCVETAYMPSWCLGQDGGLPGRSPAALAARAKSKARVVARQIEGDATAVATQEEKVESAAVEPQ